MRRTTVVKVLAVVGAGLACGPATPTMTEPTPVKSTPLEGKIDGKPWKALSATASLRKAFSDDAGERWVDISSKQLDCGSFGGSPEIITVVPWQTGAVYNFGLQQNLTFVIRRDAGVTDNDVSTLGRLEVISAPPPDAGNATLRIRAVFKAEHEVEGEISVQVCD